MIEATLSKRYARALLELAEKRDQVAVYYESLTSLNETLNSNVQLKGALENPFFDIGQRLKVVAAVASKMGFDEILSNFVKYLTKKGRMSLFSEITFAFQQLHFRKIGALEARITTAKKMDESFYKQITQILEKKTSKKVSYVADVKPEVLGGVSVVLDGRVYDGTITSDLNRLESRLKNLATL